MWLIWATLWTSNCWSCSAIEAILSQALVLGQKVFTHGGCFVQIPGLCRFTNLSVSLGSSTRAHRTPELPMLYTGLGNQKHFKDFLDTSFVLYNVPTSWWMWLCWATHRGLCLSQKNIRCQCSPVPHPFQHFSHSTFTSFISHFGRWKARTHVSDLSTLSTCLSALGYNTLGP